GRPGQAGGGRGMNVEGWRFERAPLTTLTRVPTLPQKQSGGQLMAIATERRAEVSVTVGGREITFETGKLAKQADGAVVVRSGDTLVLATAQGRMEPRRGADCLRITVNGASAALMISPLPFLGPVGAVRVGIIDGELVVNPTLPEVGEHKELDLIVVGSPDALTMVEAGANQVSEERLLEALDLAHAEV